jgi:hypothetical protein
MGWKGFQKNYLAIIIALAALVLILAYLLFYQDRMYDLEKKKLENTSRIINR